jgi:hypothetical protein
MLQSIKQQIESSPLAAVTKLSFGSTGRLSSKCCNKFMKTILLISGVVALLPTTGCLISDGGGRGHYRGRGGYEHHDAVIVGPPVVEVRVPLVEVRPPAIIVH